MNNPEVIQDRARAGKLLAWKLHEFVGDNAVVTGITRGGVLVAAAIAAELGLPLEIIPCRKIKHPSDNHKSLGAVCGDEVSTHYENHDIPQDYIYHQINMIRYALALERKYYYGDECPASLNGKTVIVADDWLQTGDTILASLKSILKQNPHKLIVAIPFLSIACANVLRQHANEIIYLQLDQHVRTAAECFIHFPDVEMEEVKASLRKLKHSRALVNHHNPNIL